jgi:hypothetical protein
MVEPDGAAPRKKTDLPPVHESFLPREHGLYRPRHSPRQRTSQGLAVVFFFVPLLLLAVGVRPPALENRPLADFPSPADGWGFFSGFDRWATDHLPLRDAAVVAADGVSRGVFGEPYQFGQKHDTGPVPGSINSRPLEDESFEGVDIPRTSGFPDVVEGTDGWLYLGYDVQAACQSGRSYDEVFGSLRKLRQAVESSGRTFVLTVAPNKATMVPEHLPDGYLGAKCYQEASEEFWRRVGPETGAVDLRPGLEEASRKLGAPVYFQVDTHWTHEAGVVLARTLAEQIEPGSTQAWRETPGKISQVTGDLPKLFGRTVTRPAQTYDLAPDGKTVRSRSLNDDFKEPKRFTQPSGTGAVEADVGLIGDSFAFTMASYLVGGFSDITLIHSDMASSDPQRVGRMLAEQDVVVLEAVERSLVGGTSTLLTDDAIDAIASELAKKPR